MPVRIHLAAALRRASSTRRYRLCGTEVRADMALDPLAGLESRARPRTDTEPAVEPGLLHSDHPVQSVTTGALAGRCRRITLTIGPAGVSIDIEDVGRYRVSSDGDSIELASARDGVPIETVVLCTLGLPLVLCLASRGIWLLHASAVRSGDAVVALAGVSGAGKSTLADALDQEGGWHRIADDLLALRVDGTTIGVLPGFPQGEHRDSGPPLSAGAIRLATIAVLEPLDRRGRLCAEPMKNAEIVLAVAEHTVGARAFPRDLLARHFEFCRRVAEGVDGIRIGYPHSGPALREAVSWISSGIEK